MKKIDVDDFRVSPGKKLDLAQWPTLAKPIYHSKDEYQQMLGDQVAKLSLQQNRLYASNQYALLIVFQAMDAAGKDSTIKHVMSGVNPQGCDVHSFKHPSAEELEHDFLWKATRLLPERGKIGIFNRSYYEEVLVVRVHPEILKSQNLPPEVTNGKHLWRERFRSIANLERHLSANGTGVIKFFLHLSKEEQRKRFLARIDTPDKNWKFGMQDLTERGFWKDYMKAYTEALPATSTHDSPWFIVPADNKENMQLIVSQVILDTLKDLKMEFPKSDAAHRKELEEIRKKLEK